MRVNEPITNREIELDDDILIVSKTDLAGRITFVNNAFIEISGYEESELVGAPHNILRHPHMPAVAFADLWKTIKSGRPWEGLVKNRTKNGDHYWVRANATPVMEKGEIVGYISVRTKPSRAQIQQAETLYAAIREGRATDIYLSEGQVMTRGLKGYVQRFLQSLTGRISGMALSMLVMAVLGTAIGLLGMYHSNEALRSVYHDRVIPAAQLADIQKNINDSVQATLLARLKGGAGTTVQQIEHNRQTMQKVWADYMLTYLTPEEAGLAQRYAAQAQVFDSKVLQPAVALLRAGDMAGLDALLAGDLVRGQQESLSLLKQLIDLQIAVTKEAQEEADADFQEHGMGGLIAIALSVLLAVLVSRMLIGSAGKALRRMENHFAAIARGDMRHEIPAEPIVEFVSTNAMLRAMKARLAFSLEEQTEANRRAEEFLRREMLTLTEVLEGEVQETVGDISSQATRLSEGASRLSQIANDLRQTTTEVSDSIQTTAGNVQTVASATEELEASSREISSQVGNSTRLAETARKRVDEASQRVAGLTEASARIGNVVGMIQNIAGQTRMLALNATIEAARAGEAGKGFAVVAEEVKGLARQTEDGIARVNTQADDIGRTTRETVDTVSAVAETIREIDAIADEVARAAEEQRAATAEIMSSAVQAADHTRSVADSVTHMMQGVDMTSVTAQRVTDLSSMVSRDIAALQRRLNVILRSSYGGNRRNSTRVPVAIHFRADFNGVTFDGYTGDLSECGALLVPGTRNLPEIQEGIVHLDGIGDVRARLLSDSVVGMHIRFDEVSRDMKARLHARIEAANNDDLPFVDLVKHVAQQASSALQKAVEQRRIGLDDLFHVDYDPIPDTDPVQVMAKHTLLTDELFPAFIEPPLTKDARIVFCCITDRNGYIATHNAKVSHPQRPGEPVWNAANCRNRRIFDDRTGILAARNVKPCLAQTYARDMGGGNYVLLKELDSPITVSDRHWGAVRMALKLVK